MALAFVKTLRHPPVRRLTIDTGEHVEPHHTPFAFIGNNVYGTSLAMLGRRASLTDGLLWLFIAKPRSRLGIIGLVLRAAFGRLDQASDFEQRILKTLTIRSRHRHLSVSFDGEVMRLRTPLHYRSLPAALRVLLPRADG
jgi:diacylglycerol kinase family enzyme